jgi:hypothetical protein
MEWFKVVNIAGEVLTGQEIRNISYTGPWLTDAKKLFSKTNCPAYQIGKDLVNGSPIRQEFLETALYWISNDQIKDYEDRIKDYMDKHAAHHNALELWRYFQDVITWVNGTFPKYRREMKGIDWGTLYRKFGAKDANLDPAALEKKIADLMIDDDVTNNKGIYAYVLDGDERHLNIRAFSEAMKRSAYEKQKGICAICGGHFAIEEMEGDHITPWHLKGPTSAANCQMLCRKCNREKSGK